MKIKRDSILKRGSRRETGKKEQLSMGLWRKRRKEIQSGWNSTCSSRDSDL
jgi:hypothetical protein